MNIPIFPLPIYLLPGGVTRLRIFEQRYLKMVKNVNKTDGFAICYANESETTYPGKWASWVDIIDFKLGEDSVLIIDVQCKQLVTMVSLERDQDTLLHAEVEPKLHWQSDGLDHKSTQITELKSQLKKLLDNNASLASLYQHADANYPNWDPKWVCARWLELLPISYQDKKHFADNSSFHHAVEFLTTLILDENKMAKYLQ
ncbi:LON peptidase substrate-binding domain-containing protein [Thalassotalea aquiviva]|uniref:LON peptidase substrate-binding domain-containing protein n=1 Tax=Thalassotalea aquiviva TaxID=3242415 RepID=UPI003529DD0E